MTMDARWKVSVIVREPNAGALAVSSWCESQVKNVSAVGEFSGGNVVAAI
jgi:hypothetical protein